MFTCWQVLIQYGTVIVLEVIREFYALRLLRIWLIIFELVLTHALLIAFLCEVRFGFHLIPD